MKLEILKELTNKEVLVTGGCGFIGSEITKQLSELDAKITIVDNLSSGKEEYVKDISGVSLIVADLNDKEKMQELVKEKATAQERLPETNRKNPKMQTKQIL